MDDVGIKSDVEKHTSVWPIIETCRREYGPWAVDGNEVTFTNTKAGGKKAIYVAAEGGTISLLQR